jgi:hypothetical protein
VEKVRSLTFVGASILSFLLFGPFTLPAFSQLGDKILGREEKVKEAMILVWSVSC